MLKLPIILFNKIVIRNNLGVKQLQQTSAYCGPLLYVTISIMGYCGYCTISRETLPKCKKIEKNTVSMIWHDILRKC